MTDHLLTEIDGPVAYATFNRPDVRNALSMEMRQRMAEFLTEIEHDDNVRCMVLRGTGDHFMAGGDVKSFAEIVKTTTGAERRAMFEARIHDLHPMIFAMRRLRKPIIGSVQGGCAGAGLSFLLACDMAVAADSAFFTLAYCHIGVSPDGSSTYTLPRTVGLKRSFEMAYLGERFGAEEAKAMGLVNRVVPEDAFETAVDGLARCLAAGPTRAYANAKALLNASAHRSLGEQLAAEAAAFADCGAGEDFAEGIAAFLEKRTPSFRGR